MTEIRADMVVDAKSAVRPMPLMKAKEAMDNLASGQLLKLTTTDAASNDDIMSWCKLTGNNLIHLEQEGKKSSYYISKK